MSALHLLKCVCHGHTFLGRIPEEFQSIDDLQAGTSMIEPVVSSTPVMVSPLDLVHTPGPPLPLGCTCGLCEGPEVPQRPHIPAQMSPRLGQLDGETLTFSNGGCGVLLVDALKNPLSGLIGGDDLMFVDASVTIFSLRIQWPGYPSWPAKFRAKDWGGKNGPVTRACLVSQLGKQIAEFIEAMEDEECADLVWKVGPNNIVVENLVLVSLTRVSSGSWQPALRLLS